MALSNTTQNTLRTQPYYDDYYQIANTETGLLRGEDFDFHRVLFRPRYGVQVRELTQLQTLLQAQLERLGTAQFRDGDRVIGAQLTIDTEAISGQVLSTTNLVSFFDRTNNQGKTVYASVANAADRTTVARITQFVSVDDGDTTNNYLIFKYTSSNEFGVSGVIQDSANASITATFAAGSSESVFHGASTIGIDEGVMFVSGFFVRVRPQTIVLDALDNAPSYRVGMEINEEFLDELDDVVGESLLDEANRGAVGAHRFRIRLDLAKRSLDDNADTNFIEIARIIDGQIIYTRANPRYITADELRQTLARRTYDESGDYIIRPFVPVIEGVTTANSTNSETVTTFQLALSPGKAYVRGYEIETNAPVRLTIDKGRSFASANNRSIPTSVGSYMLVSRVVGTPTPNSYFVGTTSVDLHCVPIANIDTASTTTYDYSKIGTAKVRMLETYSVPPVTGPNSIVQFANASVYKLFAYDWSFANLTGSIHSATIDANGDIELTIVKANGIPLVDNAIEGASIILGGTNSPVSGTFSIKRYGHQGIYGKVYLKEYLSILPNADTTYRLLFQPRDVDSFALFDGTTHFTPSAASPYVNNFSFQAEVAPIGKIDGAPNGYSILNATSTNKLLYAIPERFIKSGSLTADTAEFTTWLTSATNTCSVAASTNASMTLVFAGDKFSIPVGSYSATEAQEYFKIFDTTADNSGRGQIIQFAETTEANTSVRFISNASVSAVGTQYHLSFTYHHGATDATRTFVSIGKAQVTGYPVRTKNYFVGNTEGAHAATTSALENGQIEYHSLNVAVNFAYSLRTHDVTNLRKVLYKSSNTDFTIGDMSTATDVTSYFQLDTGQRDNTYEYGRAIVKPGASSIVAPTGRLLFVFDHFMHSGIGYATVDSYLSTGNVNKGMTYDDIPTYISPKGNRTINLRSVLDFRPALGHYGAANGNVARVFASSNTDANTIYAASDGSLYLIPVSDNIWDGDYQYYLPRIDVVTLASNGEFHLTQGQAAASPRRPNVESSDLLLYELTIPPYTLVDDLGVPSGVNLKTYDYKRYTMADLAKVDTRVKRLEYYTALSQLEQNTLNQPELDQNDNERFKNGIVVDNFTGTSTADVSRSAFAASIDTRKHELNPAFRSFAAGFSTDYANTTTQRITVVGDMAIPTYEVEEFISQPLATKSVSVNPFDIGAFYGRVQLSPAVDTWKSTTTLPAQIIDMGGPTQTWVDANLPAYTVWGEWVTTWTGYTNVPDEEPGGGAEWTPDRLFTTFNGQDLKAGEYQWKSWEEWEAAGAPMANGLPAKNL